MYLTNDYMYIDIMIVSTMHGTLKRRILFYTNC